MFGAIGTAAPPVGDGAVLYLLSTQYGQAPGTDTPLVIETQDVAPMGPSGVCLFRYVEVPVVYDAACTVQITPIVDFNLPQPATSKTFPSPTQRTQAIVIVPISKAGTTIRALIEVIARQGPVQINTARVVSQPKAQATTGPVGGVT